MRDDTIQIRLWDRRHGIRRVAWRAQVVFGGAGYADFVFRFGIKRSKRVVGNWPVDATAIMGVRGKVGGQQSRATAKPMPGGAAHDLEIGAFKQVGAFLAIPFREFVRGGVHGLRHGRIGALGDLGRGIPESLQCLGPVNRCSGFDDQDPCAGVSEFGGK